MKNLRTLLLVGCLAFMSVGASATPADVGKKEMCDVFVVDNGNDYNSFELTAFSLETVKDIVIVGVFMPESFTDELPVVTKVETRKNGEVNKSLPTEYRRARDGLSCN